MIQRQQSIYLLLIVILGIVLYFVPLVEFTTPAEEGVQRMFELSPNGITEETETYSYRASNLPEVTFTGVSVLAISTLIIPALALVILFLFKKRILQARLCIFLAVLNAGYYAILGVYIWFGKRLIAADWDLLFGACIPLINLVLTLMAARLILKDEALVRAADRLR